MKGRTEDGFSREDVKRVRMKEIDRKREGERGGGEVMIEERIEG